MHLAARMVEPEEHAGNSRDRVLFVVDVRHAPGQVCVDVVRERLVADARQAEADVGDLGGRDLERDVDRVQE